MKTWFAIEDLLDPAELTVRAQSVSPLDTGEDLLWDTFFPRNNVGSVEINNLTTVDYRPAADRREWNARGRRIPFVVPARRRIVIVPIEANDKIEEYEIQKLSETAGGNGAAVREAIGATIPQRVDRLASAVYRRLEVDAMAAWATGQIIQRDPEDASKTYTASFGFPGTRYTTASPTWDNAGVNAYDLFQAWITAAEDMVGQIRGAMMRLTTLNVILADAPNLQNSVKMTRTELSDRISQDKGSPFEIFVNENSVDIFDDGGAAVTRTKLWQPGRVAAIPVGDAVGQTAFAPVVRAMEIAANVPGAGVDVRGVSVFYEARNQGRELNIEAQLNALPIPDEQKVYVINAGI